jgi:hypothetical protein
VKLDKKKLLEWLEDEMEDNSQGYRAAMKWVAYQIEKGKFDIKEEVKPIRPTVIEFETDEEYDDFIKYVTSTEKDQSEGMQRMRELMSNHRQSKGVIE